MAVFIYRGPLPPDSPLFRGRNSELSRLIQLCHGEVQAYAIVYGGRQTGKTSLLLRLINQLPKSIQTCRVDFQGIPGATTSQAYNFVAQRIAQTFPQLTSGTPIKDAPKLTDFLCHVSSELETSRIVLLMEELGALPKSTRHDLANVLRSIFSNRYDPSYCHFNKLMIVLAGGFELYELAASEVSTLHNICEPIYLSDLGETEAIGLVVDGLTTLGLDQEESETFGKAIFADVNGHSYLTQRMAAMLESKLIARQSLSSTYADQAVGQLLNSADPLLHHLRGALNEQNLLAAGKVLLEGHVRFSRLDEDMAKLELLGLAREANGYWVVRNRLFAIALQDWLANTNNSAKKRNQARFVDHESGESARYNIQIQHATGIVIGPDAKVAQSFEASQHPTFEEIWQRIEPHLGSIEKAMQVGLDDLKRGQAAIYREVGLVYQEPLTHILECVQRGMIEQDEMMRTLDTISRALSAMQAANNAASTEVRDAIANLHKAVESNLGLEQKLELTLPIVPMLLGYKTEWAVGSKLDLNALRRELAERWQTLLERIRKQ